MDVKEKECLKKAAEGSVSAFEALISPYQHRIYQIALYYTKNHEDALDLSQEALLKAFRGIHGFKGESSFATWLFRITTNLCIDHYRHKNGIHYVYLDEAIPEENGINFQDTLKSKFPDPSEVILSKELKTKIKEALHTLPIELKSIVILRDIQGFCYEEISAILDLPLGTVKSRIHRARGLLKNILLDQEQIAKKNV